MEHIDRVDIQIIKRNANDKKFFKFLMKGAKWTRRQIRNLFQLAHSCDYAIAGWSHEETLGYYFDRFPQIIFSNELSQYLQAHYGSRTRAIYHYRDSNVSLRICLVDIFTVFDLIQDTVMTFELKGVPALPKDEKVITILRQILKHSNIEIVKMDVPEDDLATREVIERRRDWIEKRMVVAH